MEDKTIIIDTPEGIQHYIFLSAIYKLDLEVRTGLKWRHDQPLLKRCKANYGLKSNTKKAAVQEMLVLYKEKYGIECNLGKKREQELK